MVLINAALEAVLLRDKNAVIILDHVMKTVSAVEITVDINAVKMLTLAVDINAVILVLESVLVEV